MGTVEGEIGDELVDWMGDDGASILGNVETSPLSNWSYATGSWVAHVKLSPGIGFHNESDSL